MNWPWEMMFLMAHIEILDCVEITFQVNNRTGLIKMLPNASHSDKIVNFQ